MLDSTRTVASLANDWRTTSRQAESVPFMESEPHFARLNGIEAAISAAPIATQADVVAAMQILLAPGDGQFRDPFRQALHQQLQRSVIYRDAFPEWAAEQQAA